MKKSLLALSALILGLFLLAGCGGGGGTVSNDPNIGKWVVDSVFAFGMEVEVDVVFEKGAWLELKSNGNCVLSVDGEEVNCKWTLKDSDLTLSYGGESFEGKIENGKLTLDMMGMELRFVKEGANSGGSVNTGGNEPAPPAPAPSAANEPEAGAVPGKAVILALTNEQLQVKWKEFQDSESDWTAITLKKVTELFGAEGQLEEESETMKTYIWYASDDGSLRINFNKTTGEFYNSSLNKYGRPE